MIIAIPDGVTEIKSYAFCGCSSLSTLSITNGVTSNKRAAFYGTSITYVELPGNISFIDWDAFSECHNLSLVNYNDRIYTSKTALTTILTVTGVSVDAYAFNNTGLQS